MSADDRTTSEEWRDVQGFTGYQVSDHGRVRSKKKRGNGLGKLYDDWRPKAARINERGYHMVGLNQDKRQTVKGIHQLVARAFLGEPKPGQEVRHLDGNPGNNHVSNLAWGTRKENHADKRIHGTLPIGERHGMAKLTEAQAREIKDRKAAGENRRVLAADYGIDPTMVDKIASGACWKHL